jgi:hypothetical protein
MVSALLMPRATVDLSYLATDWLPPIRVVNFSLIKIVYSLVLHGVMIRRIFAVIKDDRTYKNGAIVV